MGGWDRGLREKLLAAIGVLYLSQPGAVQRVGSELTKSMMERAVLGPCDA